MTWLKMHKNDARMGVLLLLAVAMLGPWTYSADGVPPPEWCRAPFILLEDGRCVKTLSAAWILTLIAGGLPSMIAGLMTGAGELGESWVRGTLIVLFAFLLVLPFVSTLLLIHRGIEARRLRVVHAMVWGLAVLAGLLAAVRVAELRAELWGVWLYSGLAAGALALELLLRPREERARGTITWREKPNAH